MAKRLSRNTFIMDKPPTIRSYAAVVGKKEGDGPLGRHFDQVYQDPYFGQDTWEKAESELLRLTVMKALEKGKLRCEDINYMFAGDLINQCTSTSYALRAFTEPAQPCPRACSWLRL